MTSLTQAVWPLDNLKAKVPDGNKRFHIFLDNPTMRVEYLNYPAGHVDRQQPHDWDELYYIISGRSQFTADGETSSIKAGDIIFVAAHILHKFHDITEDLSVIVFFSKGEAIT